MKRVLVSEDNEKKFKKIKEVLLTLKVEITHVKTAKEAVIKIMKDENYYDYLVQDMQLPLNINDKVDIRGGIYVLNQLRRREINIKTIICSSENQRSILDTEKFENINCIQYSNHSSEWIELLKDFIIYKRNVVIC